MRYLKKFESLEGDPEEEFREFCRTYLANLLDDHDYDFSIRHANSSTRGPIYIFLLFHDYSLFEWDKVKDHIIPFLHLFRKKYSILDLPYYQSMGGNYGGTKYRYIDEEPINRTIRFQTDRDAYYYTNIDYVINDKDVPKEFYQIQIIFS